MTPTEPDETSLSGLAQGLARGLVQRLGQQVRDDPRLQDTASELRREARSWRAGVRDRADERLEELIQARRGQPVSQMPDEVGDVLTQRRQERAERQERERRRQSVLNTATTTAERRVLSAVLEGTSWAGGEQEPRRYTQLLDHLAPTGDAAAEMEIHRALWSLAEREVLSVSPQGRVSVHFGREFGPLSDAEPDTGPNIGLDSGPDIEPDAPL